MACHKVPPAGTADCFGQRRAVQVTNNKAKAFDIWMTRERNRPGSILGTANPGFNEFALPLNDKTEYIGFRAVRLDGTGVGLPVGSGANRRYKVICDG